MPRWMSGRNRNKLRASLTVVVTVLPPLVPLEPPELACGYVPNAVAAGGENVETELGNRGAVHFGKFDFEQDLIGSDGTEGENVDDVLGIGGS